jgi:MoCo/4Fe-4S cofactor protein with predicted Tat translocation signal
MKNNDILKGKEYWRSLDQLADTPEFKEFLHREFPEHASEMTNPLTRRTFLSLMGASIAFAGLASCRRPVEKIVPFVKAPENVIPGIPKYYATTMPFGLNAYGLIVESHEGRPTKIEGNENHPSTLGKSNPFIQASILNLYDPDRSKYVTKDGESSDWDDFLTEWRADRKTFLENKGEGLAILSESFNSPTLFRLYTDFQKMYPKAVWYTYEAVSDINIFEGIRIAAGKAYRPVYHYEKAKVILSIDSDFLSSESENITANKGFAAGRRVKSEKDSMNRLYVVENNYTLTGGMSDHRLRVPLSKMESFVLTLLNEFKNQGINLELPKGAKNDSVFDAHWISELAKDLVKNRGKGLIVAGRRQSAMIHAAVFMLNAALGNNGNSVHYSEFEETLLPQSESISQLVTAVKDKKVKTLVMLGGNPVYNAPADLSFGKLLPKIEKTIRLGEYFDETSKLSTWHLPMAHYLESWGDARSANGTASIVQPLIEPLFKGRSVSEIVSLLTTGEETRGYELLRETWKSRLDSADFEKAWREVLYEGLVAGTAAKPLAPSFVKNSVASLSAENANMVNVDEKNLELAFQVSYTFHDGRFANNGWLQELPDPITKIAWDNVACMSIATAKYLEVKNGDILRIEHEGRNFEIPVWIVPGHADYSISVTLGYGRESVGRVGNFVGSDVYPMRTGCDQFVLSGVKASSTGNTFPLANTQDHGSMEGRPFIREATLEEYREDPEFAPEMVEHPPLKSLWTEHSYDKGYQWGMTIDLNSCSGCNACVVACQSENNIPIVGKEQVSKGREMHWIRLDRYFSGDLDDPEMIHQPVACQQCENAPCEQVCPVAATVHDAEGLNVMTYNRCIGTRYCSNNCPYKARRFNFFNYTNEYPEEIKMVQNPDVTVRSRGVMEKCTYCTQRINEAKIKAKREERDVRDGEIVTACQQSCPADAIVFGNINDPESAISIIKKQNRNYTMLAELNVKTRTTFLAKLRNPNPALEKSEHVS